MLDGAERLRIMTHHRNFYEFAQRVRSLSDWCTKQGCEFFPGKNRKKP